MHQASFVEIPGDSSRFALRSLGGCGILVFILMLSACGNVFEDNGTHLAAVLEKGAGRLRGSSAQELTVHYETLDKADEPYYVEVTPSVHPGQTSDIWGSYIVVSGKTSGGTSSHNSAVFVPQRLYIQKPHGGPTEVVLRKDGVRVSVIELR